MGQPGCATATVVLEEVLVIETQSGNERVRYR